MNLTEKQKKALRNLTKLEGVFNNYMNYTLRKGNELTFYEWLASDIDKPLYFYNGERKLFDKMHRIIFENSYAKEYKFKKINL